MITKPLKYFCVGGPAYGLNIAADQYVSAGVRLLRTTDIDADVGLRTSESAVYLDPTQVSADALLQAGDLLLSRSGTLGRALLVPDSGEQLTYAGYLVRFRPSPDSEPRYLAYCAKSQLMLDSIGADAIQSTIGNFNGERYANVRFPDRPLDEQRAIADYLDRETARIDALIAAKERLIELSEHRWLLEARARLTPPPGARWTAIKVAWDKRTASGTTPATDDCYTDGGGIPWITTSELREGVVTGTARQVTTDAMRAYPALKVIPAGAILVAMYGATIGRLGILGVPATVNQACCAIWGGRRLTQEFLYWWLRAFREELVEAGRGAGQSNISQETLRALRVATPGEEAQRSISSAIADAHAAADKLVCALGAQINLLRERREALITGAVTGRFEVPVAV